MRTIYVFDSNNNIVAEIKTVDQPNGIYFLNALAHAFSVDITQVVFREDYDKKNGIYRCSVCKEVPVDVHNGYDTCPDCIGRI